jgi:hypothetical protein
VDNTNEWVAWGWANAKMKQQNSYIDRKRPNPKYVKHDIKDYHQVMFKHVMKFLKQHENLKKPFLEHSVINFLKDLLTEDLVTLCELLVTEITKSPIKIYATLGKWDWVSQHEKNKLL